MSSLRSKLNVNLSLPPATKGLLIGTTVGSLILQFLKRKTYNALVASGKTNVDYNQIIVPYLQLIPNHTLLHPWTLVTSIFVDVYIWRYLLSIVVLFFAGKFIERSWSSKELVKFIVLNGSIANLATSFTLIFSNLIFGINFFNIPIDGNMCTIISYIVVLKQLIPEHSIVLFKTWGQIRVKQIPLLALLVISVLSAVSGSLTPALQAWYGFIVSWSYLRFFQPNVVDPVLPQPNDVIGVQKIYGDASDTFSLVHFFPDAMSPVLSPLFNQVFELMVQLGLLSRFDQTEIEQGNLRASRRATGMPSTTDSRNAAERRRQVALKVLQERIGDDSKKPAETST